MKKIMLSLVFAALLAASCKKQINLSPEINHPGNGSGPQSVLPVLTGSWVAIALTPNTSNNRNFLSGSFVFNQRLPEGYQYAEKLVYARSVNGNSYNYILLPMQYRTIHGDLYFRSEMTDARLDILIHYENYSLLPNFDAFINYNYRYVIVPKPVYENSNIDWRDYTKVAAALNFPQ
jgi:hypothetical protein